MPDAQRFAVVVDGLVDNVVMWDGESEWTPQHGKAWRCPQRVAAGWLCSGEGQFTQPPGVPAGATKDDSRHWVKVCEAALTIQTGISILAGTQTRILTLAPEDGKDDFSVGDIVFLAAKGLPTGWIMSDGYTVKAKNQIEVRFQTPLILAGTYTVPFTALRWQ
ncbi:hypothetical protein [Methylopila sp. 73B]|uniref:hypothetical protein n=1 Tax=Methylopila sp. 73B TaxID=1120792 RepID=UPI00055AB25F|nr:hypothetical protein [Methylopila sp. 73B]